MNLSDFNPNSPAGKESYLFGLPYTLDDSEVIIIPVPWDVTVSYSDGTSKAPEKIMDASKQVDLFDPDIPGVWKMGVFMTPIPEKWKKLNSILRKKAKQYIEFISNNDEKNNIPESIYKTNKELNKQCHSLKQWVKEESKKFIEKKKIVGILGGEHSSPLGLMEQLSTCYPAFGVLQIDAHCDLRDSYENFAYSHASIMFNALRISQIARIVQVGIRDFCEEESEVIAHSEGRVVVFTDRQIKERIFGGDTWKSIVNEIVARLPAHIYVSFDMDGLDPALCPGTGTPVPGGFSFEQAAYLLKAVVLSGKKIIGFDLCESGNSEWDANVASRILFKLIAYTGVSNGKLKWGIGGIRE